MRLDCVEIRPTGDIANVLLYSVWTLV